jgi:hypothetical protein
MMSWNQNGNGQQQQRKIPEPGRGRLRPPRGEVKLKPDGSRLTPNFVGLGNWKGQIISFSLWYEPAKAGSNGQMMPESFNMRLNDPDQQQQQPQQQMQYPPQQTTAPGYQQVYAQPAPGPAYAPSPQPPQHGGYAPAPGYVPPPPVAAPPAPQWGGQPAQGRPPQAQAAGYQKSEIPF